jgi:hypothetical protein
MGTEGRGTGRKGKSNGPGRRNHAKDIELWKGGELAHLREAATRENFMAAACFEAI